MDGRFDLRATYVHVKIGVKRESKTRKKAGKNIRSIRKRKQRKKERLPPTVIRIRAGNKKKISSVAAALTHGENCNFRLKPFKFGSCSPLNQNKNKQSTIITSLYVLVTESHFNTKLQNKV